jgi:hypothetical protein
MKIKELFETSTQDETARIKQFIKDYKEGNGAVCGFPMKFPQHKIVNGEVIVSKTIRISHCLLVNGKLPFKFKSVGQLMINVGTSGPNVLTSFEGFPDEITGQFTKDTKYAFSNVALWLAPSLEGIKSWKHFPAKVNGDVSIGGLPHLSLVDLPNYLKEMDGILNISQDYEGPLLSVFKIKGCKSVFIENYMNSFRNSDVRKAVIIVNKYLHGDRNVLECQEELMNAGFKEFAKM